VTALARLADRVRLPYPVLLVLAGIGLGLVPELPPVVLAPDLVFFVFLPPLLYAAAWNTSWPDFKAARRPIGLLALGCVLFSTTLVAVVAHVLLPGFGWATAFVLGAIVSPPDAVAAAAATTGLSLPKRVTTILEGESLVNDATGLTAFRYAVAAVATGQFGLWQAGAQLVWVAVGGLAIGLAVGWILYQVHRSSVHNTVIDISLTLLTPYLAYLLAEEAHVSSVLAVVAAGLFLSRRSARLFTPAGRLQVYAVWNTVTFLLNGIVFILIGLQLPTLLAGLGSISYGALAGYAALISLAVIVSRLLWVFPATYVPFWLSRRIRTQEPRPSLATVTVVAWTGMRGVVSLAAALSLPMLLPSGAAFPQRSLILLLTFAVIFVTLVGQGLSLKPLIRGLHLGPDASAAQEELDLRVLLATRTANFLGSSLVAAQAPADVLVRMKTRYEQRLSGLQKRVDDSPASRTDERILTQFQELQAVVIQFERGVIEQLRQTATIGEDALRKLENELDLEEALLTLYRP
jgi:CPA1 family monovalent cation:H+ antiporter